MATRSERFHAEEQRHQSASAKKRNAAHEAKSKRVKRALHAHENRHAAKKATYALEAHSAGSRPSRKSTRGGANRAKADANIELRGERARSSPKTRARAGK